ncbi:MAG: rRNA pseudouridine synthase [Bacteroidaceae bacterium]|nr:rRNA pseudouridine synthase [Bacteroidaceae bacterium]
MEDRRNNYYGGNGNRNEDYENRYNRFDGNDNQAMERGDHGSRRRFVRVGQNRQYSRVERGSRYNSGQNSYGTQEPGEQRPHFYRERVQGNSGERPENGYQRRPYDGQRPYNNNGNNRYGAQPRRKPMAPRGKHIEYHDQVHDPDEPIRLNKFLANAGVCSRREADDFIKAGVVKVNGETVTELGCKVKRGDNVLFHDQLVSIERKIYILLNKPKDCVTTVDDPQERKTVMDYVKNACKERIYPVGRLDRNTTGVLLLTNDGELTTKLTHPKFLKKKVYHARLDRNVESADLEKLMTGVDVGDGDLVRADEADYVNDDRSQVGIEIHSGRNRIVRRMFDALGYKVVRLDRVQFAGLTKKRLRRGDWRFLTEKEVNMLRMGAYE